MKNVVNLCGATTTSGEPCRRACADGYTRCNLHGGHTPLARQAAQEALAAAALPSARVHLETVARWFDKRCPTCGYPNGSTEELRAVQKSADSVLNRTGFHPSLTVQVPTAPIDYDSMTEEQLAERALRVLQQLHANRRIPQGEPQPDRMDTVPVEGETIDPEREP